MPGPESVVNFVNWIPTVVVSSALGVVWLDIRKFKKDIRHSLYADTGTTRYVPRGECADKTTNCQHAICKKIDEMKKLQKEINDKIEKDRESNDKRLGSIEKGLHELSFVQKFAFKKHGLLSEIDLKDLLNKGKNDG